ncbi:hypothetical protein GGP41_003176 [Bipolaris sorokiniana]|uniref:Uncharacterized protein n=1 Tax=Cochliobolus sativus TaxID=45130 RepID=A0A8H5ZCQ5_COCSA|nr:hypothetical protein GGP41_003176 [Bipolaris sorokiniana]
MISSDGDTETEKKTNKAQSTRPLRAVLDDAKARIQQLKDQGEKAQRDLLAEQEKAKTLQTEKDGLTSQLTTTKAEQQSFIKEMVVTEERMDLKNQVQHLTTQNADLTTRLKHLATEKEEITSKNTLLRTENIFLRDETQRLKSSVNAAPPPTPQSTSTSTLLPASPAPSSIVFTEEDVKLDNLMWCTRNMVLGEFGEFGVTVRRLREWMEEDEQQQGTKKQKQRVGAGG